MRVDLSHKKEKEELRESFSEMSREEGRDSYVKKSNPEVSRR